MKRFSLFMFVTVLLYSSQPGAQILTEWVETRDSFNGQIALGYPVPRPVDTPLPFDGFRSYAGLHTCHQELVATTPWVHPEPIGSTRMGRTIWAYRLGDDDLLTIDGLPEYASLTNGGIHAREWQSPETVTGIMELFALHEDDNYFYDYLRDNVNMIVIPSLNIDGFLQTQRYPSLNYLFSDPDYPDSSPRDGRMRRKNMLSADEDLYTIGDHLRGVDLNRNNDPFWSTDPDRSSADLRSIVHHGAGPASEPEIQALDAAAQLGPVDRLRVYTDVHSFSQVHFWTRNNNDRLADQTERVLETFSDHHVSFPAGKYYAYANRASVAKNYGIGSTDEYFTHTYQVPAWTLEIEPSSGQLFHAPLPGGGADYGGVHENGHDGFILPDSEIRRVREQLAQSFAAVFYRQAGPPAVQAMRIIDQDTGATVFEAEWDVINDQVRSLYSKQLQDIQLDHGYHFWMSFNKPMRWREAGEVVPFPGQSASTLDLEAGLVVNDSDLTVTVEDAVWLDQPGKAPNGYMNYQDDALRISFRLPADDNNIQYVTGSVTSTLEMLTSDMMNMQTDSNPGTVADWVDGAWRKYEDGNGLETDFGGTDKTVSMQLTDEVLPQPFVLEAGISSSWYDPAHDGEGFQIEMLGNGLAVMYWYTYDKNGAQDWLVGVGDMLGNRIEFHKLYRVSGGEFGPGFDPDNISRDVIGSASFIWSGCDEGDMSYWIGPRHGRMQLSRITHLMGIDCGKTPVPPESEEAYLSGSWYDPTHDGEGYNIEVLSNGQVVIYWYSFDPEGNRRWFFGVGDIVDGKLVFNDLKTTSGGIFGPDFNPATVELSSWGTLELDLNCSGGTATYNSTEAGFGSGTLNVVRLTSVDQLGCPQ